ncbi:homing endonuclease associated repeat-containing protein [Haloferax prahovense]|uniref:homing endonuclease associated repeat-containing protein n=1 Tax=Haloferax prahovense TaxID=381852 RepID=UPI001C92D5CB
MPRGPTYTENELLNDLRQLAESLGRVPRKKDMNEYGEHGARTYQLRFGSWSDAVRQAGFEPLESGSNYRERPSECPLCKSESTGLDFHHWRYGENEVGCYLCRSCHDAVHRGQAKTSNPDWLVHCIGNLIEHHIVNHENIGEPNRILERYNLPNVRPLVEKAISEYNPD